MHTGLGMSDYLSMLAIVAMLVSLWMHCESGRRGLYAGVGGPSILMRITWGNYGVGSWQEYE
jgi:hypothetical protein